MDSKVFQCCYTNAVRQTGATTTSGWQTVAVSPEIPQEAYTVCSKLQNANSTIQTVPKDENGDVLKLTEIYGDGSFLYVLRTGYGLIDRLGRPNMFSHAYIFSLKEGPQAIADPNLFLSLDETNFKLTEEEAEGWDGKLSYVTPTTLDEAMERAGIDGEEYIQLLRCVYAQFSERKAPRPLYVQYDGAPGNMRDILYCIYYGLPYGMRRALNVASCTTAGDAARNLIFSRRAREKDLYVDPATGENNILTPRLERRIARYGYIDHAARELPHGEFSGFFAKLDKMAETLGDPTGQNDLTVKLAYTLLCRSDVKALTDDELETTLSDILRLKPTKDEQVNKLIADLVGEFDARRLDLSDENELTLSDWIASTGSDTLKDAGTSHSVSKFFAYSDAEAAEKLAQMTPQTRDYYFSIIEDQDRGQAIMNTYFDMRLNKSETSWSSLGSLLADSGVLRDPSGIRASILNKAEMLYSLQTSRHYDAVTTLNGYMDVLTPLVTPEERRARRHTALEEYWRGVNYDNFTMDRIQEYLDMRCDDIPQSRAIVTLVSVGSTYDPTDEAPFFLELRRLLRNTDGSSTSAEKERIVCILRDVVASRAPERADDNFRNWVSWIANAPKESLVRNLVRLRVALYSFDPGEIVTMLRDPDIADMTRRRSGPGSLIQAVEQACEAHDSKERPVPLDLWLTISSTRPRGNPFNIFNSGKAYILSADPAAVVRESVLIKQDKYLDMACTYAADRGEAYKVVKRWVGEAERDNRVKSAPESPRSGGFLGFFGKK